MTEERELEDLRREVRQQNRTLAGIQHWLKVAAEYQNDDPVKRLDGVQAALAKGAEYVGRSNRRTNGHKQKVRNDQE